MACDCCGAKALDGAKPDEGDMDGADTAGRGGGAAGAYMRPALTGGGANDGGG